MYTSLDSLLCALIKLFRQGVVPHILKIIVKITGPKLFPEFLGMEERIIPILSEIELVFLKALEVFAHSE